MQQSLQLSLFNNNETVIKGNTKAINVSTVPQRSPFRYAGGKTWLVPTVRRWLNGEVDKLIEPFCGGGTVGLTAAAENLANSIIMIEKDEEVAAVWEVIFSNSEWLIDKILTFQMTHENVNKILHDEPKSIKELAFRTIIKNRTFHGGILAKGAGLIKQGENGKGLTSRWYPVTIARRIKNIAANKCKIKFIRGDAFDYFSPDNYTQNTYYFIDPPYYTAGKRLYTLSDIDHEDLFCCVSNLKCHFLLTYDKNDYILSLVERHKLQWRTIPMQTTHLTKKYELLISDNFKWLDNNMA